MTHCYRFNNKKIIDFHVNLSPTLFVVFYYQLTYNYNNYEKIVNKIIRLNLLTSKMWKKKKKKRINFSAN